MSATLISAGYVLIGRAGRRITDGAVLVQEGRIAEIGPRDVLDARAPVDALRLDFAQGTLMPGLIDCHVHLAFDASPDVVAALQASDDVDLALGMAARARRLLEAGVTTVRDLGDRAGLAVRLREAISNGLLAGPRILTATSPLTVPGGHCWFFGGEVEAEETALRARVAANAAAGADVIKVMVTGGHLTPGGANMFESQFSRDEIAVIVDEATRLGLPVAAHAHGTDGIADAVAAGVSTVEHCTWLSAQGFNVPDEVVADIVERGVYVCPAISRNWKGYPARFGAELTHTLLGQLGRADAEGVKLAAGTDSGVPGAAFGDYVGALEVFAHVGFDNARILELATIDAAAAIGLSDVTGTLAVGLDADLLVVDGDPLADLQALRDVQLVMARGRLTTPAHTATATKPKLTRTGVSQGG